jgi:hypothetical protein
MSDAVVAGVGAEEAAAPHHRSLWNRMLPPEHRFMALWLAGGVAVVSLLSTFSRELIGTTLGMTETLASLTSRRGLALILARPQLLLPLSALALAFAVWMLFRYTKAPKALALCLIASAGVRALLKVVGALAQIPLTRSLERAMGGAGLPARTWWSAIATPLAFEGVVLVGVAVGAWLAWATRDSRTGARMSLSDMVLGPDEDASEPAAAAPPLAAEPPSVPERGIADAFGWRGWDVTGASGLALGLLLITLVVGVLSVAINRIPDVYAYSHLASGGGVSAAEQAVSSAFIVIGFLVYTAVYTVAIRRFGISPAVWLVALASALGALVSALLFVPSQMEAMGGGASIAGVMFLQLFGFVALSAPFLGALIATRRGYTWADSATLPAEEHTRQ